MKLLALLLLFMLEVPAISGFSSLSERKTQRSLTQLSSNSEAGSDMNRRDWLTSIPAAAMVASSVAATTATTTPLPANAAATKRSIATPNDGNLPDLPPEAVRSYLQYRIPLQIAADSYIFDLQGKINDIDQWGDVQQLYKGSQARGGQGQPSKLERDFINPMRIVLLSLPPDEAEDLRTAQFQFEASMGAISKATSGYRKDLPVEIPQATINSAIKGWEDGRVAWNAYCGLVNKAVGLNELIAIPPAGPNQRDQYGRSKLQYNDLIKKTKLCQNRGGPVLSQTWGQLMVTGYLQDSCGIPSLENYFIQ